MMNDMFGIRYAAVAAKGDTPSLIYNALSGLRITWRCHSIGRCPMLAYYALSGQASQKRQASPEGVIYTNDGCSPSKKQIRLTSPEGA